MTFLAISGARARARALCTLLLCAGLLGAATAASAKAPETDDEKGLYYIGYVTSRNLSPYALTPAEAEMVMQGLRDALAGKKIGADEPAYLEKAQAFAKARTTQVLERERVEAKKYLEQAAAQKGAKTTESGLIYTEIKAGSGTSPGASDTVKVHYHGTLRDGTVFDSSVQRGQPAEFPLNRVIPCWTEGVTMMKPGGKSKLVCPAEIAYGDRGSPPVIPGGAALTFEVELIEVAGGAE